MSVRFNFLTIVLSIDFQVVVIILFWGGQSCLRIKKKKYNYRVNRAN